MLSTCFLCKEDNIGLNHPTEYIRKRIADFPNWFHQIEVAPGIVTPGFDVTGEKLAILDGLELPRDFSGMRVLDIGARDGFFSFMAEQRHADEVIALDHEGPDLTGFNVAKELLNSNVEFVVENVYHLTPDTLGYFDVVFFLGVFYHLRHPLLALDRIRSVMKPGGQLFIEPAMIDRCLLKPDKTMTNLSEDAPQLVDVPLLQFLPGDTYFGDATNMFAPNMAGLRALAYEAEFETNVDYVVDGGICKARGYLKATAIVNNDVAFFRNRDEAFMETRENYIQRKRPPT